MTDPEIAKFLATQVHGRHLDTSYPNIHWWRDERGAGIISENNYRPYKSIAQAIEAARLKFSSWGVEQWKDGTCEGWVITPKGAYFVARVSDEPARALSLAIIAAAEVQGQNAEVGG